MKTPLKYALYSMLSAFWDSMYTCAYNCFLNRLKGVIAKKNTEGLNVEPSVFFVLTFLYAK